ncbi:MAG: alginate export family protein [Myxococcota bacterium]
MATVGLGAAEAKEAETPLPVANADEPPAPPPVMWEPVEGLRLRPSAQLKVRYRYTEGRDFRAGGEANFVRHRARVGFAGDYEDKLAWFVQLQDVRTYGEETSPFDTSADGFDAHQFYGEVRFPGFFLRVGRQQLTFENERILGVAEWGEPARSYGAVSVVADRGPVHLHAFAAQLSDEQASTAERPRSEAHLFGANLRASLHDGFRPALLALAERDDPSGIRRYTVGGLVSGDVDGGTFRYTVDGYGQFGRGAAPAAPTIAAALAGVRLAYAPPWTLGPFLRFEAMAATGDTMADDAMDTAFTQPFGAPHRHYGEFDLFVVLPRDTDRRGLVEVAPTVGLAEPLPGLSWSSRYHHFSAPTSIADRSRFFGHELDHHVTYRFWRYARVDAAYATFWAGGLLARSRQVEHFAYVTTDLSF